MKSAVAKAIMKQKTAKKPAQRGAKLLSVQLARALYQRVKKTARQTGYDVKEVIVSALETSLPKLPDDLPLEITADLQRWSLLDDSALSAIASAFLPAKQQRRYSTLLRKADAGRLNEREQIEWEGLQEEYLRFSQNKAKAQFLLAQRKKAGEQTHSALLHKAMSGRFYARKIAKRVELAQNPTAKSLLARKKKATQIKGVLT